MVVRTRNGQEYWTLTLSPNKFESYREDSKSYDFCFRVHISGTKISTDGWTLRKSVRRFLLVSFQEVTFYPLWTPVYTHLSNIVCIYSKVSTTLSTLLTDLYRHSTCTEKCLLPHRGPSGLGGPSLFSYTVPSLHNLPRVGEGWTPLSNPVHPESRTPHPIVPWSVSRTLGPPQIRGTRPKSDSDDFKQTFLRYSRRIPFFLLSLLSIPRCTVGVYVRLGFTNLPRKKERRMVVRTQEFSRVIVSNKNLVE